MTSSSTNSSSTNSSSTNSTAFAAGAQLRRARRIARLSQRELAARAQVPLSTLARIESGLTADPRVSTLDALFAAAGCRLAVLSRANHELPEHPWEAERDHGVRHFPAHLDLWPVNPPYNVFGRTDWWGWYRSWAWQPGARIPALTFNRFRNDYYCPPLDPVTGLPRPRPRDDAPARLDSRDDGRRARPAG
ncbi:MAG TPA: helix-turn-helix transcriptional regulator [Jatrophihabitantaceae bacterium]|jgi:transcriptional regulator with XRE-family HTH domain|nr:helix-turn-helix transcriptional regulator [Jatrophihabitantaceae bacterium]